jgi:hypothetical protein
MKTRSSLSKNLRLVSNMLTLTGGIINIFAIGLPDYAPRYIVLNYKSDPQSFPKVIFINWIPSGCQTAASMLHVGTLPVIERLVG